MDQDPPSSWEEELVYAGGGPRRAREDVERGDLGSRFGKERFVYVKD